MAKIWSKIKDIKRFDTILNILFEEGFGYFIYKLDLNKRLKLKHHIKGSLKNIKKSAEPVRVRKTMERLGPTFIKLGQILSVRPDLLPPEYITELKKLQEDAPGIPFSEVKIIVEKELGKKISEVFKSFEEKPLASASIAQVHVAELKTGEKVAVKVRKPKVKEIMTQDIEIMLFFAHLLNKHFPKFRDYDPVDIVREFSDWTFRELDFRKEGENITKFRKNLSDQKVVIPKVYDKYTTEELLVMEYVHGEHIDKFEFKKETDKKEFVQNFVNVLAKMIFEDGFFHGDPHPGNIFVVKNNIPLFLDFGMVGNLSKELKGQVAHIFTNLSNKDTDLAIDNIIKLTQQKSGANIKEFKNEARTIIEHWYDQPIQKCSFVRTFYEIISISAKNKLLMPADLVLMIKALLDMEGIVMELDPDSNVETLLKPWMTKMVIQKFNPVNLTKELINEVKDNEDFYSHLPGHIRTAIKKVEEGNFDVHLEEIELTDLKRHIDFSLTNAIIGVIIVSLFFSSSLLFAIEKEILFFNIPLSYIEILAAFGLLIYLFARIGEAKETYK